MNVSVLEIIDTSVKIGLGALIGGGFSYFLARINHRANSKKEFSKRYFNAIELISESAEDYYDKWSNLSTAVSGVQQIVKGKAISGDSRKFIKIDDDKLMESRQNQMVALSRLRLLQLKQAAIILGKTSDIENRFRDIVIFKKVIPSAKVINDFMDEMEKNRKDFFDELSKHYTVSGFDQIL